MKISHFFLPHPETHKKAHLISIQALTIYVVLFIFLQVGLNTVPKIKPGVLGISAQLSQEDLISLTNQQRKDYGLAPLTEDSRLDAAALAKAKDMFAEDYWAHYSPSGKTPWDFIQGAGYQFTYAGENLARNFYTSQDVVTAWMNSPTHKENIINPNYENIGMAVLEGTLQGQDTVLVVQEFGRPVDGAVAVVPSPLASPQVIADSSIAPTTVPGKQVATVAAAQTIPPTISPSQTLIPTPTLVAGLKIDPYSLTKTLGLSLIGMIAVLTLLDFYVLRRRAVATLGSRHLPHLAFLSVAACTLIQLSPGRIL